ncbi:MAG: glutamate--tRNA ligase [Candidatus Cloacimonetes bacterium]|nr:glutamate--tRNA ligase [Candidatus Cloacimonadota bacterium]
MNYKSDKEVRVRFAPSPTGFLHVGGLRTALFNYLFARKNNGKFILRIEDTDRKRYIPGALEKLISTLKAIGLAYDEGPDIEGSYSPYVQSKRINIYKKYAQILLNSGNAYYCFCSEERLKKLREEQRKRKLNPVYDGKCRNLSTEEVKEKLKKKIPYVIRLKFPKKGTTVFYDKIHGRVEVDNSLVDDQILIKSDGFPTYHLANVVDDHLMKITHIIRGEEWLSSVPKHIFLYKSFGWEVPKFVHLPLLLNPDRSKLSKRQGDVAVESYLEKGYLPEALINFIALLGWHSADDKEIYSLKELEKNFSLRRINKSGAVFDIEKLNWMNGHYLRSMDIKYVGEKAKPFFEKAGININDNEKYLKVIDISRKRVPTLSQLVEFAKKFYFDLEFTEEYRAIIAEENSQRIYSYWIKKLKKQENWSEDEINLLIKKTMEDLGVKGKELYFPLRLALFGSCTGPELPTIIEILGREETVKRLEKLINK